MSSLLNTSYLNVEETREACKAYAKEDGFAVYTIRSDKGKTAELVMGCRHFGQPRDRSVRDEQNKTKLKESIVFDERGAVTASNETKRATKQKRVKNSQRFGCPFVIKARPVCSGSSKWIVYSIYGGEHNHPLALDVHSYPMNRRLDPEAHSLALQMINAHASNNVICSLLKEKGHGTTPKDISNLRQTVFNNDPDRSMFNLIHALQDDGYYVRYDTITERDNQIHLRSLFFAHESPIVMAQRCPDVGSLDATYKTNKHKMPFVNVVGKGNVGFPKLKTFCIAGGWLSEETNETYSWFVQCLREVVWPYQKSVSPAIFITDSETALMNALDTCFPESSKILCRVHLRRNFKDNLQKYFAWKGDYEKCEKAINYMWATSVVNPIGGFDTVVTGNELFEKTIAMFEDAIRKSSNPERARQYLNM